VLRSGFQRLAGSLCLVALTMATTSASGDPQRALFWSSPEPAAPVVAVRAAAARALAARHVAIEDEAIVETAAASLGPKLARAVGAYSSLHLDDAVQALQALATEVAGQGGGDLDRRSLADVFLDTGLALLELGRTERAWDAFVQAARLDPTRTLDPAQVAPRAAVAFRRAVTELAQSPRVELSVDAPPEARLRLDGELQPLTKVSVVSGTHFVQISAPGFETWRGAIVAAPPVAIIHPTLKPIQPPSVDRPGATLSIALHRSVEGSRWAVRVHSLQPNGRSILLDEPLEIDVDRQLDTLVDTAFGVTPARATPVVVVAPPPRPQPLVKKWWLWTAVGVAAGTLAIGLGVGLTRSHGEHGGSAGGNLGAL
jgi:hypothetical protein